MGTAAERQPKVNGIGSKWTVRRDENVRPSGIKTVLDKDLRRGLGRMKTDFVLELISIECTMVSGT